MHIKNISFAQIDIIHKDKSKNLDKIASIIDKVDTDIIVFPELCNTGYLFDCKNQLYSLAENIPNGDTTKLLLDLSLKKNISIIAGIAEKDDEHLYNSAVVVSNGKYIGRYRKIHLSDYEKKLFSRGLVEDTNIFELGETKIALQICFDIWFNEISRKQILNGADIIFVLANFGSDITTKITKVRAIENLTPIVLCNRIGKEKSNNINANFLGNSFIIDYQGNLLSEEITEIEYIYTTKVQLGNEKKNIICNCFMDEISIHLISK